MQRLLDLLERDKYSPDKLTCLTNDLIVRTEQNCCPLAVNALCFKVCTEFAMENGYNEN